MKKIVKVGLIISSFLLAFLLLEISVRLYQKISQPVSETACRQTDKLLHHRLKPNSSCRSKTKEWDISFQTNSLGFRDQEYPKIKPDNTYRIIFLGDSFTEGFGISGEKTFPKIIEQKLKEKVTNKNIEVINAGITGYSPLLEYLQLVTQILPLQPNLIVLNFSMTDFYDDYNFAKKLTINLKQLEQISWQKLPENIWVEEKLFQEKIPSTTWLPFIPTSFKWFLHSHLKSYDFTMTGLKKIIHPDVYKQNILQFTPGDPDNDQFSVMRNNLDPVVYQKLLTTTQKNLLLVQKTLKQNNIKFLLVIIPYAHQVDGQEWGRGRQFWGFEKNKIYSSQSIEDLVNFSQNKNIEFINLLPAFQKSKQENPEKVFYFSQDGHWTTVGHSLAAEIIYPQLVDFLQTSNP